MDKFTEEIRALDRAIENGSSSPLSATGISQLAKQRRKRRAVIFAAGSSLAIYAIYGLVIFQKQPVAPATAQDFELNAQLLASIKATEKELEETASLRRNTQQLLNQIQQLSTNARKWNDPFEDASVVAFFHARQHLERGADSDDVQNELKRLQAAFPNTVGARQAEELATDLSNRKPPAAAEPKSSLRTLRHHPLRPAPNQIAKDI